MMLFLSMLLVLTIVVCGHGSIKQLRCPSEGCDSGCTQAEYPIGVCLEAAGSGGLKFTSCDASGANYNIYDDPSCSGVPMSKTAAIDTCHYSEKGHAYFEDECGNSTAAARGASIPVLHTSVQKRLQTPVVQDGCIPDGTCTEIMDSCCSKSSHYTSRCISTRRCGSGTEKPWMLNVSGNCGQACMESSGFAQCFTSTMQKCDCPGLKGCVSSVVARCDLKQCSWYEEWMKSITWHEQACGCSPAPNSSHLNTVQLV
jgi:hypothetical protein